MQTYTGKALQFDDPKADQICIEDIAHALSNICRFSGHCKQHYSVAQHSVYVSQMVDPQDALSGLLHDATEAYIGDMVSPLKRLIPQFATYEDRLWRVIARKYKLPADLPISVKRADLEMLSAEARDLCNADPILWGLRKAPENIRIIPWTPEEAKVHFLDRFHVLTGEYATAMLSASGMP
jgi:hypothetical protein